MNVETNTAFSNLLANLNNLYLRPTIFFLQIDLFNSKWLTRLVLWFIATNISFSQTTDKFNIKSSAELLNMFGSWSIIWLISLAFGLIGAVISWYVGGWFFNLRIKLSGAVDIDKNKGRLVWLFASLSAAIPLFIKNIYFTIRYQSLAAASSNVSLLILLLIQFLCCLFYFWSLLIAYKGVITCFDVQRNKALFWFIIGPLCLQLLFVAVLIGLTGLAWLTSRLYF